MGPAALARLSAMANEAFRRKHQNDINNNHNNINNNQTSVQLNNTNNANQPTIRNEDYERRDERRQEEQKHKEDYNTFTSDINNLSTISNMSNNNNNGDSSTSNIILESDNEEANNQYNSNRDTIHQKPSDVESREDKDAKKQGDIANESHASNNFNNGLPLVPPTAPSSPLLLSPSGKRVELKEVSKDIPNEDEDEKMRCD